MFPVILQIGNTKIYSYGFFIALAYIAAVCVSIYAGKKENISANTIIDVVFIALMSGLVGARILFVITLWQYFKKAPLEIFFIWQGGLVFFGGLLAALPCIFVYAKINKIQVIKLFDVLSYGLVAAQAIGRIGCLGAGCCHGKACDLPWAVRLNTDLVDPSLRDIPVHPTQIYESLGLLVLLIFLVLLRRRNPRPGIMALAYLIGYSVLRSITEIFRGDSIRGFLFSGLLSTSQFISAIVIIGSLVFAWRLGAFRRNQ